METLTIKILNRKVVNILKDLEKLNLIQLVSKEIKSENNIDWIKKYKGSISRQNISEVDSQLKELRSEWE